MPFKRIINYSLIVSVSMALVTLILLPHFLPDIMQKLITDRLVKETGLKNCRVNVRSIGLSGIDFGEIKLGKTINIDSVNIDYNLSSLIKRKTDQINISGLVVRAKCNGSHIEFPDYFFTELLSIESNKTSQILSTNNTLDNRNTLTGRNTMNNLDFLVNHGTTKKHGIIRHNTSSQNQNTRAKQSIKIQNSGLGTAMALTFLPDKISIMNSCFIVTLRGNTFIVPFNMNVTIKRTEQKVNMTLEIFPFGEKVDISLTADIKNGIKDFEMQADSFCLDEAYKVISVYFPEILLTGYASVRISKKNDSAWVVNISHIGVRSPFKADINDFISGITAKKRHFSLSGSFVLSDLSLVSNSAPASGTFTDNNASREYENFMSPVKINYSGSYGIQKDGKNKWDFYLKAKNAEAGGLLFESKDKKIHMKNPDLDLSVKGIGFKGNGYLTATCSKGEGQYKNIRISFPVLDLTGKSNFNFSRTGMCFNLNLKAESKFIKFITDDVYSNFPDIKCFANFHLGNDLMPELTIRPVINNAMIKAYRPQIRIQGIDLALPMSFPFNDINYNTGKIKPGIVSVKKIFFKGRNMGSLKGTVIRNGYGGMINGTAVITGFTKYKSNGFKINFRADGGLKKDNSIKAELRFDTDKINISSDTIKDAWLAPYSDIEFHCSSILRGYIGFNNNKFNTGLDIDIMDGSLSLNSKDIHASGISTFLKFDDLLPLRSAPGQVLFIDKVSSHNIKISKGVVKYSIESINSFLIEKASCNWCGGRVTTGAVRFSPDKNFYSMILYCDRLKLSEILQQVGSFKAQGDGSLNGNIPVHYDNGNLSFDNGFLFSTPGIGGEIKVQDTGALTAGIPPGSPKFAQIDLAGEALKNYKYKWAKLNFNTGKDGLLVKMEFDGEPAENLPFEYKRKLGRFIRVSHRSPGSHFQEMKIDVNLKIPFNGFIKFGGRLNKLLNRK